MSLRRPSRSSEEEDQLEQQAKEEARLKNELERLRERVATRMEQRPGGLPGGQLEWNRMPSDWVCLESTLRPRRRPQVRFTDESPNNES